MSKFTKGTWIVHDEYDVFSRNNKTEKEIFIGTLMPNNEAYANARLIAAAPEMYDILTRINNFYANTHIKGLLSKSGNSVKFSEIEELLARIDGE